MESRKRNSFIDFVKGVAILLVVLGHTLQYTLPSETKYHNLLFVGIYGMHMPLFMFISGYLFYYQSVKYEIRDLLSNKIRTILVPALSYTLLISIVEICIMMIKQTSFACAITDVLQRDIFTFVWFLWALAISSIVMLLLLYIGQRIKYAKWLGVVTICISDIYIPNYSIVNWILYLFPFIAIGYYVNKHNVISKVRKHLPTLLITSALFYFALLPQMFDADAFIYRSGLCILTEAPTVQLKTDIVRFLIGIFGTVMVLSFIGLLFPVIEKFKNTYMLIILGASTLPIYGFSMCRVNTILCSLIGSLSLTYPISVAIDIILVIVVCLLGKKICQCNKFLNSLFLGGRI